MLKEVFYVQGKKLVFVTNNSTKSRAGYLKKFTGLGLNVSAVRISIFFAYCRHWLARWKYLPALLLRFEVQFSAHYCYTREEAPKHCYRTFVKLSELSWIVKLNTPHPVCRKRSTAHPTQLQHTLNRSNFPRTRRCFTFKSNTLSQSSTWCAACQAADHEVSYKHYHPMLYFLHTYHDQKIISLCLTGVHSWEEKLLCTANPYFLCFKCRYMWWEMWVFKKS